LPDQCPAAVAWIGLAAGIAGRLEAIKHGAGGARRHAQREPDPGHRRRTLVRQTARAEELGETIFAPVISGTIGQAAAYPDDALASIAEFLSAHRALLTDYLATVSPAASNTDPGGSTSTRADS
jgi:hypothetical protein